MAVDLFALAGDLGIERKRCLKALQRLQGLLIGTGQGGHRDAQKDAETRDQSLLLLERLARSTQRLGTLTQTLESELFKARLTPVAPLFSRALTVVEDAARRFGKPVAIGTRPLDARMDSATIVEFEPPFLEMLVPLVEYCIEDAKERHARGKGETAQIEFAVHTIEGGHRVSVTCDGNGVIPPYASVRARELADIGVRAEFEGLPSKRSTWNFYVPIRFGPQRLLPVTIGSETRCIPSWAVTGVSNGFVTVAAGINAAAIAVDDVGEPFETYLKPLPRELSVGGRYLGVVERPEKRPEEKPGERTDEKERESLTLVLNPADIVYGGEYCLRGAANAG